MQQKILPPESPETFIYAHFSLIFLISDKKISTGNYSQFVYFYTHENIQINYSKIYP